MKFAEASREAGLESFIYEIRPSLAAARLLATAKFLAKQLSAAGLSAGHRKSLEAIAKTCAFQDWHALQTFCKRLIGVAAEIEDVSKLATLIGAIPLLLAVPDDVPADGKIQKTLISFSENLAEQLNANPAGIRDCLATVFGAESWQALCHRRPIDSALPLYSFFIEPPSLFEKSTIGRFVWSSACSALVEELDFLWQDYGNRSATEKVAARQFVVRTLEARPDFLEGWLALASMTTEDEPPGWESEAMRCFNEGIKRSEALIPKKFNGIIEWGYTSNRFYHRLLCNAMRLYAQENKLRKAIALARKQLRLNPTDNLGIRIDLPVLLAASAQPAATRAALKKIEKASDGFIANDAAFVFSLCHFALNEHEEGVRYFLQALLTVPPIRQFILMKQLPNQRDRSAWRGVIPDFDIMWTAFTTIYAHLPLGAATFTSILGTNAVLFLETDAEKLYLEASTEQDFGRREAKFNHWQTWVQHQSIALAPRLAAKFWRR